MTDWSRVREWYRTRLCLDCLDGRNCPACEGCDCDNEEHTKEESK